MGESFDLPAQLPFLRTPLGKCWPWGPDPPCSQHQHCSGEAAHSSKRHVHVYHLSITPCVEGPLFHTHHSPPSSCNVPPRFQFTLPSSLSDPFKLLLPPHSFRHFPVENTPLFPGTVVHFHH